MCHVYPCQKQTRAVKKATRLCFIIIDSYSTSRHTRTAGAPVSIISYSLYYLYLHLRKRCIRSGLPSFERCSQALEYFLRLKLKGGSQLYCIYAANYLESILIEATLRFKHVSPHTGLQVTKQVTNATSPAIYRGLRPTAVITLS